jgi:cytoskeletal protein RodZ
MVQELHVETDVTDVSGTLRAARERAGLSLEDLSARTRIKFAFLEAIEAGQFQALPGEFFTRAFLRTYAREVHLPPDQIVGAFDASRSPLPGAVPDRPQPPTEPTIERGSLIQTPWLLSATGMGPVAVIALVLVTTIYMWARPAAPAPEVAAASAGERVGTAGRKEAVPAAPAPAPAAATVAARPSMDPEFLVVEISTTAPTWITATADGERAAYRLFATGERLTIRARDELSFRLGNAGAFQYSINGTAGRPVGRSGNVREFRISRDNYRDLLANPGQ